MCWRATKCSDGKLLGQVGDDCIMSSWIMPIQRTAQRRRTNQEWQRVPESAEISRMHHNVLDGFLDVRPALSTWGTGNAIFRGSTYPRTAVRPGSRSMTPAINTADSPQSAEICVRSERATWGRSSISSAIYLKKVRVHV